MPAVALEKVDVVFGPDPAEALAMLDKGESRDRILELTAHVVGAADASIAIAEGEICVLMGLSGSGKSTLLRCINGLNHATRGRVLVEDEGGVVDVASCDAATLRRLRMRRIAMVFQQFALLPWRTVAENVGLGLELRGMGTEERDRIVQEKLELVGLDQWADKYAHELSGGMQQRVGLARAFATDADILLMDEPFSALDPLIRDKLQDELLALQRSLRKTIVFVSHDLDEALKIGTRIAIMEGGRIIQIGTPEEIITRPATDYVRAFVANVNPLNVLKVATLMRGLDELVRDPKEPSWIGLDNAGLVRIEIDADGRPVAAAHDGVACALAHLDPAAETASVAADAVIAADRSTLMRTAIEVLHRTGRPMAVLEDGRLAGAVGPGELLAGMLRRSHPMDDGDGSG